MITYVKGNLFEHDFDPEIHTFIPHVCNDKGAFSAGFVVPLAKEFPQAKASYLSQKGYLRLGQIQVPKVAQNITVINMIAQTLGGERPLNYEALVRCMKNARAHINATPGRHEIIAPLFGSGLAGGSFEFIEQLIEDIWPDFKVTIYYLKESDLPVSVLDRLELDF